ncbi:hypothetical protein N7539_008532 [Penicillium diatomitis]|uniref:Uncharacterized protein n=1 Tax=Penicillium diatomitis TaxID=2819901 RepID=A0A9W9WRG5_9EURO|nr:uncharacterized protein N7539_008532 [Penicillium diatomitis]KAJ5471963.1 hypothetical protein N7539_008532 [Penicillium diatomitis]
MAPGSLRSYGTIIRQLRAIGSDEYSSVALYSGPHGLGRNVDDYGYVLLVAINPGTWYAD